MFLTVIDLPQTEGILLASAQAVETATTISALRKCSVSAGVDKAYGAKLILTSTVDLATGPQITKVVMRACASKTTGRDRRRGCHGCQSQANEGGTYKRGHCKNFCILSQHEEKRKAVEMQKD